MSDLGADLSGVTTRSSSMPMSIPYYQVCVNVQAGCVLGAT